MTISRAEAYRALCILEIHAGSSTFIVEMSNKVADYIQQLESTIQILKENNDLIKEKKGYDYGCFTG